jgi:mRNA-degrading endonuclease toxin of MazEF toxin-antitoxin module
VPAGFAHDQGARPWLVVSAAGLERAIALPVSTVPPMYGYPLSWPVPGGWGLERTSWVLIDHVRSLPVDRLRDGVVVQADRGELDEILAGLLQLIS